MKHPLYNFSIYQGADEVVPFSFYTGSVDDKTPKDLSGCTFIMTLKQGHNKPVVDVLTSENNRIELSKTVGDDNTDCYNTLHLKFPNEVTTSFIFPSAIYDLFKIAADGTREILLQGTIEIEKSVSYG
jgi:hypothetical protein